MGSRHNVRLFDPDDTAWMDDGLCRVKSPEVMFPVTLQEQEEIVERWCTRCRVREECVAYALEYRLTDGVWGSTERERRKILKVAKGAPSRCGNGHPLTADNLRWTTDRGGTPRWRCGTCSAEANRRQRQRDKAKAAVGG